MDPATGGRASWFAGGAETMEAVAGSRILGLSAEDVEAALVLPPTSG